MSVFMILRNIITEVFFAYRFVHSASKFTQEPEGTPLKYINSLDINMICESKYT